MMEARKEREREYHNKAFAEHVRSDADKYYTVTTGSRSCFEEFLESRLPCRVLEYGCGPGSYAFYLARRGATVTGIDISTTAIDQARARAKAEGLERNLTFQVMDAESLDFPNASFDLICGVAIMHHLDLHRALGELARTLRPGGAAAFLEPLGHNPFINMYRRLTPALRTVDEHPLMMRDLELAKSYFGNVESRFFTLNPLAAVPFRNTRAFPGMVAALGRMDETMFRVLPFTRRYAWQVVLTFQKPLHQWPA